MSGQSYRLSIADGVTLARFVRELAAALLACDAERAEALEMADQMREAVRLAEQIVEKRDGEHEQGGTATEIVLAVALLACVAEADRLAEEIASQPGLGRIMRVLKSARPAFPDMTDEFDAAEDALASLSSRLPKEPGWGGNVDAENAALSSRLKEETT